MKKLFIVITFLTSIAIANEDKIETLLNALPDKSSMARMALAALPANQRQGIMDYLNVVGIDVDGGANVGIEAYNVNLLEKNLCFQDLARDFYNELTIRSVPYVVSVIKKHIDSDTIIPTSLETSTKDINQKSGWLWELAMQFAKKDPLLAMQLIGICGHDDVIGDEVAEILTRSPAVATTMKSSVQPFKAQLKEKAIKSCEATPIYKNDCLRHIDDVVGRFASDGCPTSNIMYIPGSLGPDISQNLKDKIANIQAPTKGASALPAKYYHIMGSAFTSCFLVRRGMPDILVRKIATGAINAYRAGRLCKDDRFDKLTVKNENGNVISRETSEQVFTAIKKYKTKASSCIEKIKHEDGEEDIFYDSTKGAHCRYFAEFEFALDPSITDDILLAKLKNIETRTLAITLYSSSSWLSSNKCEGPQLTTDMRDYFAANGSSGKSNPCTKEMSADLCKRVRDVMDTWAVDFEWSEAQHLAGAEFAIKNCRQLKPGEDPLANACNALGKTSTPDNTPAKANQ